jgi:phosphatidylinositol glycan class M
MWFLCLLPLVLPSLALNKREGTYLIIIWAAAQVPWLYLAYNLEFLGKPVFLNLWITSITWFAVNVEIARTLLAAWRPLPL